MSKPNLLLSLAVVLALGAGIGARIRLSGAIEEVSTLRNKNELLEIHRRALKDLLNDVELDPPFLAADVAVGLESDGLLIQEPGNVVLYRLSTDCTACRSNYGFLNDLTEAGVPVIGLAVDSIDAEAVVERHQVEWDVRFPILVNSRGSATEVVPRYGTPTTVVISQGKVVFLEFGKLEPEARQALKTLSEAWPID